MAGKDLLPAHPFESLHREVDRLFGGFMDDFSMPRWRFGNGAAVPRIDLKETEKAYELDAEIPGVPAKEVQLSVHDGVLTLKGEKKAETEQKDKNYIRVERTYGSFERSVSLPDDADEANITAAAKDGVLTITIPKNPKAKPQARTIAINAG